MELDADYLDRHRESLRARWRLKLAALAVFASVVMLGDLVVEAKPLDGSAPSVEVQTAADIAHVAGHDRTGPVFKQAN